MLKTIKIPHHITDLLSMVCAGKIELDGTLIIYDERQDCLKALHDLDFNMQELIVLLQKM